MTLPALSLRVQGQSISECQVLGVGTALLLQLLVSFPEAAGWAGEHFACWP